MNQEFFEAIESGDAAKVDLLLEHDRTLASAKSDDGLSAVLTALYYHEPDIAHTLVAFGAELNIFEACAVGEINKVKELIKSQPDLINAYSADGFQPLGLAAFFGQADVVEFLVSKGANVNSASNNKMRVMPLHSSVASQDLAISTLLLKHGADVNAIQADDFTPLHEAAQNGQIEMVELILKYKPDLNARKTDGKTALAIAIEYKHEDIAELLRRHGATL
jgi:ankyrin repeat protein